MIRKIKVIGLIFICLIITSNNILGAGATVTSKIFKKVPEIAVAALITDLIGEGIKFFFNPDTGTVSDIISLKEKLASVESDLRSKDDEIANEVRTLRSKINSQTTRDEYNRMALNTINSIDKRVSKLEREALEQDIINQNVQEQINGSGFLLTLIFYLI